MPVAIYCIFGRNSHVSELVRDLTRIGESLGAAA
jgi:hypothetical protein